MAEAQGFFFGDQATSPSRRRLFEALMQQGLSSEPVTHWAQGAANAAKAMLGAYQVSKQDAAERDATAGLLSSFGGGQSAGSGASGGATSAPSASATPAPSTGDTPARPISFQGSQQDFIAQMMPHAQRVAQQTGLDPRLVIAQAALESGYGRSAPGNNFFGIKSHGQPGGNTFATTEVVNGQPVRTRDSFRAYGGMGESADGYARFLQQNPRYRPMLGAQGLDAQINALGASGYATDPNYAAKIRQIANSIRLPDATVAAPTQTAPGPQQRADIGSAVTDELSLTQPTALTSIQPEPVDAAWEERLRIAAEQDAQARPLPPSRPAAAPAIMDRPDALGGITPGAPTAAPIPAPRPVQIAQGAPIPQARPNIEPPVGAQPAIARPDIARALGMPERDRIMLMRDEASLAPGEADALRAGMGGGVVAPAPGPAGADAVPAPRAGGFDPLGGLRNLLMGGAQRPPSAPATQVAAMGATGAPASPQAGGDQRQKLMRALMNPNLPAHARQMGMAMLQQMQPDVQMITTPDGAIIAVDKRTRQMTTLREAARPPVVVGRDLVNPTTGHRIYSAGPEQTPDQRNYDTYVRQEQQAGRTPDDFTKWMRGNRRESSGLDTPDEAFQKELGKNLGTQIGALIEDGRQAGADLRNIAELETLMGQIGTGATAEAKRRLGELGITFEGTDRIQAVNALLSRLTPQQRVPGSGATSDFDAKMFRDSLPRLINQPNGNRLIMDTMRQIAENRLARSDIATRMSIPVSDGGLSRSDGLKQLQELSRQAREISTRVGEAAGLTGRNGAAAGAAPAPVVPPQGAIDVLRGNPSPTARRQFDEVFGPGSADRILRGQ